MVPGGERTAGVHHGSDDQLLGERERVPTKDLAADLDRAFGTDFFGEFYPLVVRYAYPSWFLPYVEMEREATSIRMFDSQVVSGLLQTEEYARALLASGRPDNVDDLLAARMTRQAIFEKDDPPRTWIIMDENALTRAIGGAEVMRAQLARILAAGAQPRTVIQVVPKSVVAHPGLAGPFTLLSFKEGADVLYVDGFSEGRTALDASEVASAAGAYDLLRACALSPEETAGLLRRHMEELTP